MSTMVIDIRADGILRAVAGMDRLVAQARQFQAGQASMGGGGGNGGGGSRKPPAPPAPSGPFATLAAAQQQLQKALQGGSPTQILDARFKEMQARKSAGEAQKSLNGGPGVMERLGKFITSSGLGTKGGMQLTSLAGPLMELLGATGPIGLAVEAGAAVLSAFAMAVHQTAETLSEIRNAAAQSGGNTSNMAGLMAMGMSPDQIPSAAAHLREALHSGGMATAYGARIGLSNQDFMPAPFGSTNSADILERTLKGIAKTYATSGERLRAASAMQMDSFAPLIETYARHTATIDADAKAMGAVNNTHATTAASDFMFQLGRLGEMFQLWLTAGLKPILAPLAGLIGYMADFFRLIAERDNVMSELIMAVMGFFEGLRAGFASAFADVGDVLAPLKEAWQNVTAALGPALAAIGSAIGKFFGAIARLAATPILALITWGVDQMVKGLKAFADALPVMYGWLAQFVNFIIDHLPDPLKKEADKLRLPKWEDLKDPMTDLTQAVNHNTKATQDQTGIFRAGTFGGGARVRGAVPGAARGPMYGDLDRTLAANRFRLGAFV